MPCFSVHPIKSLAAQWGAGLLLMLCLSGLFMLTGCADTSYYLQSAQGHVALMRAAKPVDDWITDPQTAPELKARLALSQKMRRFAVTDRARAQSAARFGTGS